MPRAKKTEQPEKPAQDAVPTDKLLGGWMPKDWWGEKVPKFKVADKTALKANPVNGMTSEFIARVRRRVSWLRAIVNDNSRSERPECIPFSLENDRPIQGEEYFLILCQMLFREYQVKWHLGEDFEGEDVVRWLIDYWSQGPLTPEDLRHAVENSSLD